MVPISQTSTDARLLMWTESSRALDPPTSPSSSPRSSSWSSTSAPRKHAGSPSHRWCWRERTRSSSDRAILRRERTLDVAKRIGDEIRDCSVTLRTSDTESGRRTGRCTRPGLALLAPAGERRRSTELDNPGRVHSRPAWVAKRASPAHPSPRDARLTRGLWLTTLFEITSDQGTP
jgi:hypothetical protein